MTTISSSALEEEEVCRRVLCEKNIVHTVPSKVVKKEKGIDLRTDEIWIDKEWIFIRCGQNIQVPEWWENIYTETIFVLRLSEQSGEVFSVNEVRALYVNAEQRLDLSLARGSTLSEAQKLLGDLAENIDCSVMIAIDQDESSRHSRRRSSIVNGFSCDDEEEDRLAWLGRAGRFETISIFLREATDIELSSLDGRRGIVASQLPIGRVTIKAIYPVRDTVHQQRLGTVSVAWTQDQEFCEALCPPPANTPLDGVFFDLELHPDETPHDGPMHMYQTLMAMKSKALDVHEDSFFDNLWHPQASDGIESLWPKLAAAVMKAQFEEVRTILEKALAAVARGDVLPSIRKENTSSLAMAARASVHAITLARYGGEEGQIAHAYAEAARTANHILSDATEIQLTDYVIELGFFRLAADLSTFFAKVPSCTPFNLDELKADAYTAELRRLAARAGITDCTSHNSTNRLDLGASLPTKTRLALAEPILWHAANASRDTNPRVFVRLSQNDIPAAPSRKPSNWTSLLPASALTALERLEVALSSTPDLSSKQANHLAKCLLGATPRAIRASFEKKRKSVGNSRRSSLTQQDDSATLSSSFATGTVSVFTCTRHDAALDFLLTPSSSTQPPRLLPPP